MVDWNNWNPRAEENLVWDVFVCILPNQSIWVFSQFCFVQQLVLKMEEAWKGIARAGSVINELHWYDEENRVELWLVVGLGEVGFREDRDWEIGLLVLAFTSLHGCIILAQAQEGGKGDLPKDSGVKQLALICHPASSDDC